MTVSLISDWKTLAKTRSRTPTHRARDRVCAEIIGANSQSDVCQFSCEFASLLQCLSNPCSPPLKSWLQDVSLDCPSANANSSTQCGVAKVSRRRRRPLCANPAWTIKAKGSPFRVRSRLGLACCTMTRLPKCNCAETSLWLYAN